MVSSVTVSGDECPPGSGIKMPEPTLIAPPPDHSSHHARLHDTGAPAGFMVQSSYCLATLRRRLKQSAVSRHERPHLHLFLAQQLDPVLQHQRVVVGVPLPLLHGQKPTLPTKSP